MIVMQKKKYYNYYSNALERYLFELYDNPKKIDEYKLDFLKDFYYILIKNYINVSRKNLLMGVHKNPNYLWFQSKLNLNLHLIFDRINYKFYIKSVNPINIIEKLEIDEIYYKKYKLKLRGDRFKGLLKWGGVASSPQREF